MNKFSKNTGYRSTAKDQLVFLYSCSKKSEKEILKKFHSKYNKNLMPRNTFNKSRRSVC